MYFHAYNITRSAMKVVMCIFVLHMYMRTHQHTYLHVEMEFNSFLLLSHKLNLMLKCNHIMFSYNYK